MIWMNYKRKEDINRFLLKYKEDLKETDDFLIDAEDLYDDLVRINTKENINCYDLFDKWEDYGKNMNSLTIYQSQPVRLESETKFTPYFLCVKTKKSKMADHSLNQHKIYLSLKPEFLEQGVMRIMSFVDRENIEVYFKVGRLSRDDQLVIRVGSHEDCDKVISFINNDDYLRNGKNEATVFPFQKDGISLAVDGYTSYNDCMTMLVYKYLQYAKYNNKIDEIGYNSFVKFVKEYYEEHFIRKENLSAALGDFKVSKIESDLYRLIDYKYCIKFFLESLSDDFTYDSYKKFIDDKKEHYEDETRELYSKYGYGDRFSLFFELCDVMIDKMGYEQACKNIVKFIISGNSDLITRDNDLRTRVDRKSFYDFIYYYVKTINMSIEDFINSVYFPENDLNYDEIVLIINDGIRKTYMTHNENGEGMNYAGGALYYLIMNNNYNGFTREDGIRDKIKECISRDDLINVVKNETGVDVINEDNAIQVISSYIRKVLKTRVL